MRNIISAALLLASLPAFAEPNWLVLSKKPDSELSIDLNSIAKQSDGTRRAWMKLRYEKPQRMPMTDNQYLSDMQLASYRCSDGTSAIISITSFKSPDGVGESLGTVTPDKSKIVYLPPIPGSVGEHEFRMVCGKKLK